MKTISDFKRRMQPGTIVNSSLFWKDKEGNYSQVNELKNRECKISQSNSFALTAPNKDGEIVKSWCDWPKKEGFTVLDENTVQIDWEGGKLIYQFV